MRRLAVGEAYTRSQCSSMVVPTPMARPSTAAIIGLVTLGRRRMKSSEGAGMPLPSPAAVAAARRMKSLMSLPAENTPPEPMNTWQAMASLVSDASSASDMALYMGPVKAFFLSARVKRMTCTPSCTLISISWVIAFPCFVSNLPPPRVPSPLRGGARGGDTRGSTASSPTRLSRQSAPSNPLVKGALSFGQNRRHAPRHLRAQRLQSARRPHHHLEVDDAAGVVEADHVDALQLLVADLGAELQHDAARRRHEGAVVAEVLERLHGLLQELRHQRRPDRACAPPASGTPPPARTARRRRSGRPRRPCDATCPASARPWRSASWPVPLPTTPASRSQRGAGGGHRLLLRRIDPRGVVADQRPAPAILRVPAKLLEAESAVLMLDDVDAPVDVVVQALIARVVIGEP